MAKTIQLSDGTQVLVDDEDYEYLMQWKWSAHGEGYAMRGVHVGDRKYKYYTMHRVIANAKPGDIVDHINMNKLDNRRSNLRICNKSQNAVNSGMRKTNTSGYKGVCWDKQKSKWKAEIRNNGKRKFLGYFEDKVEAAKTYNDAAIMYHGEFAWINEL